MATVGVSQFELSLETYGRREEMHSDPRERTAIPAFAQQSADLILAAVHVLSNVVRLIQHALAVVGEIRGEHVTADAVSVEIHAVAAERGDVKTRAGNFPGYVDRAAERGRRLRQRARIAQTLVAEIRDYFGGLP